MTLLGALTGHACARARLRGVTPGLIALVLDRADQRQIGANGRERLCLSEEKAAALRSQGLAPAVAALAAGLTVVRGPDGTVITVFHQV